MNDVLFQKTIVPAGETEDGEFPVSVVVTEESNGYAVFLCGHPDGTQLLRHSFYQKDQLIEWTVCNAVSHPLVQEAIVDRAPARAIGGATPT